MLKTILITGATSGIGKALLEKCIQNKIKVIGTFHKDKNTSIELHKKYKKSVDFYQLDLTSDQSIKTFTSKIKDNYSQINTLVNNAGYVLDETLTKTTFEEIEKQINTNLTGTIKLTKLLIPLISEQIVNIASQYAKEGHTEYVTYCASKWGLRGFTKALADELPKIKVIAVNPGPTQTKMNNYWNGGIKPDIAANMIYKTLSGEISSKSGEDIDIFKLVQNNK
ncbi:SDR family oxidoreductase [Candidatus Dojkabacteria bacterium]|nr:SDR family oxidoreductase [Candidatus Dojkabacteria bacterium]